jgi:hypothetical protein
MTDIFFSYSSHDRERVRPVRDALVAQGFEVFWDQQVPAGMDWDTWIRQHLANSKCAMAFWSAASVRSPNVRHEATIASQQDKLITVLLEPLTAEQFPMGLYSQQAANLSGWSGDYSHDEWRKLQRAFEAKLTPAWVRRQIDELEAELVAARARCEKVERRDRILQAQIVKEAEVQQDLKRERDDALDEVAALKGTVERLTKARADDTSKQAEAQQALKRERDSALHEIAAVKGTVEELTQAREHAEARTVELSQRLRKASQSKAQEIARSIGAALSPLVIAAAVATLGFWAYQLIWSAPQSLAPTTDEAAIAQQSELQATVLAAKAEAQRKVEEAEQFKEEAQRQAKAAADAAAKLKTAEADQQRLKDEVQRQAKAAGDAEAKLKAAEIEQQRLKGEVQRQAKAAGDADAKRGTAEAASQSSPAATDKLFEIRPNMEARAKDRWGGYYQFVLVRSIGECAQKCTQSERCKVFTFQKLDWQPGAAAEPRCFFYSEADLIPNSKFDSGVRK